MRKSKPAQTPWVVLLYRVLVLGCFLTVWSGGSSSAQAQDVSYRLRVPKRIADWKSLSRSLGSKLRSILMQRGFVIRPMRSIQNGYHLDISVGIEEAFPSDEAATCTIQIAMQIVVLPQKRLVMNASSSGSSRFNRATKFTRAKRNRLRRMALDKATRYFRSNIHRAIKKIERRKRTLPKNKILGQKWRRRGRARYRGWRSRPQGLHKNGKGVPYKVIAPNLDAQRHRPPFPAQGGQ
jgi:hypothetical protein